jgi:hypothetical protein
MVRRTGSLVEAIVPTRTALHMLAEHVLAPARYAASGHIGLAIGDGGFVTPPFGNDPKIVGLIDDEIVVRSGTEERRTRVTTLRQAATFAGARLGATEDVYPPATPCEPDAPLAIDQSAARQLFTWYGQVDAALRSLLTQDGSDDNVTEPTLWPEHLDVAIRVGDVNFGGLAGDETVPDPYVYVGPPQQVIRDDHSFFTLPFGAARTWREVPTTDAIVSFFSEGLVHARTGSRRPS